MKAEISKRNPYWLEKHRYYELKHFCLQYSYWKKAMGSILYLKGRDFMIPNRKVHSLNPTETTAIAKKYFSDRINMIEVNAKKADPELYFYIIEGVTNNLSYDSLRARFDIPCCKDTYYDRYRKFFWFLSQDRG